MKKTLFNKALNDLWVESDVSMSIISRFGTGGGNTPIILEEDDDVSEDDRNS